MGEPLTFTSAAYLEVKGLWRGQSVRPQRRHRRSDADAGSQPYSKGRDPRPLGSILETIAQDMGWTVQLEQALVMQEWPDLVGPDIAEHTEVQSIQGSILHVQCDSTAWATELRRLRKEISTKLTRHYPDAGITDITFHGPHAPSWRHGYRRIQGRGPRDTYG